MGDTPLLSRNSEFAYTCNRCMSCCYDAHIALDPYEIVRLARNRNLSTTEFIARFLSEGGIVLGKRDDTSCVMLGANGCTVYADRPQICRTYPLKRLRGGDGDVFRQHPALPTSTGVYGKNGAVADFLIAHEAYEFFAAKDRYFDLAMRIAAILAEAVKREPCRFSAIRDTIVAHCEFHTDAIPALVDVDRVVSDFCRDHQLECPTTVDEKIPLHIKAIEERLAIISAGQSCDGLMEMAAFAGALSAATEARVALGLIDGVFGERESKTQ